MMLSAALLLTIAAAPPAPGNPTDGPADPAKPQLAAERVAACGFSNVRPKFDDQLQEDVVEVQSVTSASAEQLRCAALAALDSHYYVWFPGPVDAAYQAIYWRMSDERYKAEAREWLEKRGLLSRLPRYDPKRSDDVAFTHALEMLCGPKAAGTLQPMHGMATFKQGALGTLDAHGFVEGPLDAETMSCLSKAAAVSGYLLGFIGNEAYRKSR